MDSLLAITRKPFVLDLNKELHSINLVLYNYFKMGYCSIQYYITEIFTTSIDVSYALD